MVEEELRCTRPLGAGIDAGSQLVAGSFLGCAAAIPTAVSDCSSPSARGSILHPGLGSGPPTLAEPRAGVAPSWRGGSAGGAAVPSWAWHAAWQPYRPERMACAEAGAEAAGPAGPAIF